MARIKGVDIPNDKRLEISLTYIFGIGKSLAGQICADAKIDKNRRVKDLSEEELNVIRDQVSNYIIEGDLRREVSTNIKTKMEINSYEGSRHKKGLPVRGQRTSRNCRNCKAHKGPKKVIANKKK
ncbi:MAG: 30S ribosomal protein S13 [Bacilli bacterium]|nr:30S ribosomal protein S13 [Bacilli bacterium]